MASPTQQVVAAYWKKPDSIFAFKPAAGAYYQTQDGGGETGLASGFLVAALFQILATTSGTMYFSSKHDPSLATTGGYRVSGIVSGTSQEYRSLSRVNFSPGNYVYGPAVLLAPAVFAALHLIIYQFSGTQYRTWIDRSEPTAPGASTTYAPQTVAPLLPQTWGANNGGPSPALNHNLVSMATARGAHTPTQIYALFDAARSKKDLPTHTEWTYGMTHRWSVRDALGASGVEGQTAPSIISDTVTGASIDEMQRVGAPKITILPPTQTWGW